VVGAESGPIVAPPNALLYLRDGNLVAQDFDVATLKVSGPARRAA
jgi:hypothetical protein